MNEWFYAKGGSQEGPFDEAEMRSRITSGQVGGNDLVWREGMAEWLPLAQVTELSAAATSGASAGASAYVIPGTNSMAPPQAAPQAGGYALAPPTSGLAIASMVLGILAILSSCLYIGIIFGIPAVITGHIAIKSFRDPQQPKSGMGMAIAGLVCGYLGSLISLVMIGVVVFAVSSSDGIYREAMEEVERQHQEQVEGVEKAEEQIREEDAE